MSALVCSYCAGEISREAFAVIHCCGAPFHERCYEQHVESSHGPADKGMLR